jgi:hypothetical protein
MEREFILYVREFYFILLLLLFHGYMAKNLHNVCTHNQEKRIRVSVIGALVFYVQILAIKVWFGGLG